jgi:Domain of unknown function (DUF4234)
MSETPPLQYGTRSPDGRWWWDGQAWQPVPEAQQVAERTAQWQGGALPAVAYGPPGKVRNVVACILLAIVTIGIYTFFWTYWTQKEIKDHSGIGVGGGLGLVIYILVSPVTFFLIPADVRAMYERRGMRSPVGVLLGLWILLPLIGHLIWFVRVQNALNDYWTAAGAPNR